MKVEEKNKPNHNNKLKKKLAKQRKIVTTLNNYTSV